MTSQTLTTSFSLLFLLLAITILSILPRTTAITCFSCIPADPNCGVAYSTDKPSVRTCEGDWCQKVTAGFNGEQLISRTCLARLSNSSSYNYTEGCRNITVLGGPVEICTCSTSYCNGYTTPYTDVIAVNSGGDSSDYGSGSASGSYNSIKCLSCVGQQCNEPANRSQAATCRAASCFKNVYIANGISLTIKGCVTTLTSTDDCRSQSYQNVATIKCVCSDGQYCNLSPALKAAPVAFLASTAVVLMMLFVEWV